MAKYLGNLSLSLQGRFLIKKISVCQDIPNYTIKMENSNKDRRKAKLNHSENRQTTIYFKNWGLTWFWKGWMLIPVRCSQVGRGIAAKLCMSARSKVRYTLNLSRRQDGSNGDLFEVYLQGWQGFRFSPLIKNRSYYDRGFGKSHDD